MNAQAKVLFVDDDTELQALVPKILEYEGFETVIKKNGVECLEYLNNIDGSWLNAKLSTI